MSAGPQVSLGSVSAGDMVLQLVVALGTIAAALLVAAVVRRRHPDSPSQPWAAVPAQLDRRDFPRPDAPWLVVVFTSSTCSSCGPVSAKAMVLESSEVAVADVGYQSHRRLHERYRIDSVPTLLIVDASGVVASSFIGPVTATDLWAALAELRQPGSTPTGFEGGTGQSSDAD